MELKDFISKTVMEIISGVTDASKASGKSVDLYSEGKTNKRHIEFDVAVTAQKTKSKDGNAGIQVFGIQAGGKKSSEAMDTTVSRIKFGIRIQEKKASS